jgi:hypothetical protein
VTKKRELEVLMKSLMLESVLIDDRIIRGLKDGIREIRRIEFREKQERKQRQYAKKNKK